MFKVMEKVAAGKRSALSLDSMYQVQHQLLPGTQQLYFTSNHDENSWNHADFGTFTLTPRFARSFARQCPAPFTDFSRQEEPTLRALEVLRPGPDPL